jgi:hypothetical protein
MTRAGWAAGASPSPTQASRGSGRRRAGGTRATSGSNSAARTTLASQAAEGSASTPWRSLAEVPGDLLGGSGGLVIVKAVAVAEKRGQEGAVLSPQALVINRHGTSRDR